MAMSETNKESKDEENEIKISHAVFFIRKKVVGGVTNVHFFTMRILLTIPWKLGMAKMVIMIKMIGILVILLVVTTWMWIWTN